MKYNKSALRLLCIVLSGILIGIGVIRLLASIPFLDGLWGSIILLCAFYGIAIIRKGMEK